MLVTRLGKSGRAGDAGLGLSSLDHGLSGVANVGDGRQGRIDRYPFRAKQGWRDLRQISNDLFEVCLATGGAAQAKKIVYGLASSSKIQIRG